jgi:hypothetical protein
VTAERRAAPPDAGERRWRRLHAASLALLALGLGLWLWRTLGFEPLRIVEPGAGR